MPEAPRPADERERLRELQAYDILDTPPEPSFERLARLASSILGTPIALVSLVDEARQWFKASVGLEATETSRALSFCAYAVASGATLEVPDATADPRFVDNALVTGAPGIRFYAGAPLTTPAGFVLGTICGIDTEPRAGLTDLQRQQLADLAALVVDELELRRSVRLLADSRGELDVVRLATDAASDAIVITDATPLDAPEGPRIRYVNEAFVRMTGYERHAVIGQTPRMLQGPDTDRAALARIRDALQAGREVSEELLNYRKDGTPYWVEVHIAPVLASDSRAPQLVSVQHDVTERRAREQDLVEREARYRLLFEKNPQCMWVYDAETGRFLDVNEAALSIYGYTRDEFLDLTIYDIRPPDDVTDVRAAVATVPQGGLGPAREWRHRHKDGTIVDVRVQSYGTTHRGRPARLALITDRSAERRLEEQLRQSQKMEAIGALAGGLAHDFNNLLTVINGYAEMVVGRLPDDDPIRRDVEQVQRAGERAATLTQQLLAFSRRQVLQPQVVAPATVLTDLEPMLSRVIRENIELRVVAPADLPAVLVDPTQLELVLLNLIVNAADAMPSGGQLSVECGAREFGPDGPDGDLAPGRYVVISVTDTGVGMDAETLSRIFEPFFTTKPKGRGTGLGLPTAFGIVKQSRGHLSAYSEPGSGSTFRVYLPVAADGATPSEVSDTPRLEDLHGQETILLVEDDEHVRRFTATVLEEHGYTVLVTADGPAALQAASAHTGRVDLLLTDVVMPRMGGRAVAERLRQEHGLLRVLYMSGYAEDAIVSHGVLEPGLQFLAKPFTPTGLLEAVRQALTRPAPMPSIVVADDEAPLRRLLAMTLTRAGYQVFEAKDGRIALELCREHRVDLLVTDLVMPEQEGLETIRELRRELPQVRIVAMSGAFDGRFLGVARAFGADAVLQKPFDGRTIIDTVAGLIGRPAPTREEP